MITPTPITALIGADDVRELAIMAIIERRNVSSIMRRFGDEYDIRLMAEPDVWIRCGELCVTPSEQEVFDDADQALQCCFDALLQHTKCARTRDVQALQRFVTAGIHRMRITPNALQALAGALIQHIESTESLVEGTLVRYGTPRGGYCHAAHLVEEYADFFFTEERQKKYGLGRRGAYRTAVTLKEYMAWTVYQPEQKIVSFSREVFVQKLREQQAPYYRA